MIRTTIELPDPLLRRLKSKAALDGVTLKALVQMLIEQSLDAPPQLPRPAGAQRPLPSIRTGRPLALQNPSNAALFEALDDD